MSNDTGSVDYTDWDWLPAAAVEIETYLQRLLEEAAVTAHDVSARAKSISSFNRKRQSKGYTDPKKEVTDTVAVRIITYSVTDRNRAVELIRGRFNAREDRNPGTEKDDDRRGYDCHHFVVLGEAPGTAAGWMTHNGKLSKYFENFGGLEIQIRTVAAHSWAEFEHARRYKGQIYSAISEKDRTTVDIMFGAAADARRALDEAFIVIDRILASPTDSHFTSGGETAADTADESSETAEDDGPMTLVEPGSLRLYLQERFPEDEFASDQGIQFACELVQACGLSSLNALDNALGAIDSHRVRDLMSTTTAVTTVRRLDDELLARFGEAYIEATGALGNVETRAQQLEWRYDRLRDKVPVVKYKLYEVLGEDAPEELRGRRLPAARAVREVARLVAQLLGREAASVEAAISPDVEELPESARPKEIALADGQSIWVATNLGREYSEQLLNELVSRVHAFDLRVEKNGRPLSTADTVRL